MTVVAGAKAPSVMVSMPAEPVIDEIPLAPVELITFTPVAFVSPAKFTKLNDVPAVLVASNVMLIIAVFGAVSIFSTPVSLVKISVTAMVTVAAVSLNKILSVPALSTILSIAALPVTSSELPTKTYVSSPAKPVKTSIPVPPEIVSSPVVPVMESAPVEPVETAPVTTPVAPVVAVPVEPR